MSVAAPVRVRRPIATEEAARGDFYALLARLLHAGPDGALLAAIASAAPIEEGDERLVAAWRNLIDASSAMDAEAGAAEYDLLFVGVGKAVVSVYAGYYSGAHAVDHPRVRLQADLARLGLARKATGNEPEDHFAALFEVMRVLISGGAGRSPAPLAEQEAFFSAHLAPAAGKFFSALGKCERANYYRTVGALGAAFVALEAESFELDRDPAESAKGGLK